MGRRKKKKRKGQRKRPRTFDESVSPPDALDALLRDRYHGAVNIRGIRFQLRYSVVRAVELALATRGGGTDPERTLCFEGIEDIDAERGPSLRGLDATADDGPEFVQVKTASEPWTWHRLKEPLIGFLEILRTRAEHLRFTLAVNFPPRGDLDRLARFRDLGPGDQSEIRSKFRTLCQKMDATEAEADRLLARMRIEWVTEADLRLRLGRALTNLVRVADTAALEGFELMLAGGVLGWAADRARITGADVSEFLLHLRDGLARSDQFTAVSSRLVGTLAHGPDSCPTDFFEGKRVRMGHIVDGLDVRRPEWLRRIDSAFASAPVVVVRAPSGHGKSVLAYRYAYENWPESETIVVRSAQSDEEVNALEDYLRFRSGLGLPIRILIDADYRTRLWPRVVAVVASIGAKALVTVRMEDWNRFRVDALTRREVIDPTLALEEARSIYAVFRARDQIHPAVDSAAWAFERLREPPLLLEFVYLITHGQMLEERLRDQVRDFTRIGEDPKKVDLLRVAALANALGAPVPLDALLQAVPLRDDPLDVIGSLLGEYLSLEDGMLRSMHWVRSEHLAGILHEEGAPSVTSTALVAAGLVPTSALRFLVANAVMSGRVDRDSFLRGLLERFHSAPTEALLAIASGLFEAGERAFFEANRELFDKAHALAGPGALLLLQSELAPVVRVPLIRSLIDVLGERAGHAPALLELVNRMELVPRGLDLVGHFFQTIARNRSGNDLLTEPGAEVGELLDWCALTHASLEAWDDGVFLPKILEPVC